MENIPEKTQPKFVKWFYIGSIFVLPIIFILSGVVKKNPCSSMYSSATLAVLALLLLAGISVFVVACFEIARIIKNKKMVPVLAPILFFIIQIIFIGFTLVTFLSQSLVYTPCPGTTLDIDIPEVHIGEKNLK